MKEPMLKSMIWNFIIVVVLLAGVLASVALTAWAMWHLLSFAAKSFWGLAGL